ncbi:MAG: aldo/keto reductase [Acidimicrobiales bacterium mtb01]|nr:aldo/keto reductase [Actinomycetota bacterium]TEX48263.1 MAG: aldo/keto reductase [Acidimicrobiales bacterium mtb01]
MLITAPFGRTGHMSSRIVFGAAALGGMSETRAITTLDLALAAGVNHIDTAASYGASEDRLAPWLREHRSSVFLATKTEKRTADGARRQLEASLERMRINSVDLIQMHNLVEDDEWTVAVSKGGALEALIRARDEGLVRHIGVTGHGLRIPSMHLRSLQRFDFDSVLFPFNPSLLRIPDYESDVRRLRDVCRERGVAMQTIKSIARRRWDDGPAGHRSWYEPITDPASIAIAVRFVLSNDDLFLNTSSDATLLPFVLEAARGAIAAPTKSEIDDLISNEGLTPLFDGAALERI